jgi:hypothetical protein
MISKINQFNQNIPAKVSSGSKANWLLNARSHMQRAENISHVSKSDNRQYRIYIPRTQPLLLRGNEAIIRLSLSRRETKSPSEKKVMTHLDVNKMSAGRINGKSRRKKKRPHCIFLRLCWLLVFYTRRA